MTTETIPETTVPLEPTTPIKPSEAIRLGCLTYPVQTFGNRRESGCAVDAMVVGFGGGRDWEDARDALAALPCPEGCTKEDHGGFGWGNGEGPLLPAHLNDTHRWSRERIADWLEGLGL